MSGLGKRKPSNPIVAPELREVRPPRDPLLVRLYGIKKLVEIVICYDRPGPPIMVASEFSHHLLGELFEAAKCKATIQNVFVDGRPVTPATIARVNHFVSQPGYSTAKTFRGWRRINREKRDTGFLYWRSGAAWEQFEEIVRLQVFVPLKTPVKK